MIPAFLFHEKPLIVAGRALQHYGLAEPAPGDDLDLVVSHQDFEELRGIAVAERGDFGDERIVLDQVEYYASFFGLGYETLRKNAIEQEDYLIASLPKLLLFAAVVWGHDPHNARRKQEVERILCKVEQS